MTQFEKRPRTSVVATVEAALAPIGDGAVLGVGGSIIVDNPMVLIRELVRRRLRDLTVVAPTGGLGVDLLIATGCVSRIVTAYIGAEALAPVGPAFRAAVMSGALEVRELDEAMCVQGLRAAAQRLPFLPWRGGVGTSLPEVNPDLVEFEDPIRGEPLLAIPALELDFTLLHVDRADPYGNVQPDGTGQIDLVLADAAERVIVQAETIVGNEEIRADPSRTVFWRETTVVEAPWGSHPSATVAQLVDEEAMSEYFAAVGASIKGEPESLDRYVERYVRAPADHAAYLALFGPERLGRLRPEER